jgi:hypothetical protein
MQVTDMETRSPKNFFVVDALKGSSKSRGAKAVVSHGATNIERRRRRRQQICDS